MKKIFLIVRTNEEFYLRSGYVVIGAFSNMKKAHEEFLKNVGSRKRGYSYKDAVSYSHFASELKKNEKYIWSRCACIKVDVNKSNNSK